MMTEPMKGAGRCPRCKSDKTTTVEQTVTTFYAKTLEVCGRCGAAWEPFDPANLLDVADPHSCFTKPCDNCAFLKQSTERADKDGWQALMTNLMAGGRFYCHKGVQVTPGKNHGFAYPENPDGKYNTNRLRLCRGFLNSFRRNWTKDSVLKFKASNE
jgi:transcription elongation factor Elf1